MTRPNLKERKLLFDFYLKKVKITDDVNPEILARKTLWFSPADIDNMVREAGMFAFRENRDRISFKDLSQAYDRILYGEKSNTILSDAEIELVDLSPEDLLQRLEEGKVYVPERAAVARI